MLASRVAMTLVCLGTFLVGCKEPQNPSQVRVSSALAKAKANATSHRNQISSKQPRNQQERPPAGSFATVRSLAFSPLLYAEGGPFLLVDQQIYDLASGKEVGKVNQKLGSLRQQPAALRKDGAKVALASKLALGDAKPTVSIIDCNSGEVRHTITLPKPASPHPTSITCLAWLSDEKLLAQTKTGIDPPATYLLSTAKTTPEKAIECPPLETGWMALGGEGALLAAASRSELKLIELGKPAAARTADSPPVSGTQPPFWNLEALAFSPAGREIAALLAADFDQRLVVWNWQGEIVFDQSIAVGKAVKWNDGQGSLDWLPTGRGWLLHGRYLVDRESRCLVWKLSAAGDKLPPFRLVGEERVCAATAMKRGVALRTVAIPWKDIDSVLAAMKKDASPRIKPGMKVAVDLQMGATRFAAAAETKQQILNAVKERLESYGLVPAPTAPLTVYVKYDEQKGAPLEINRAFVPGAKIAADIPDTVIDVSVDFRHRSAGSLWKYEKQWKAAGGFKVGGTVDEEGIRNFVAEHALKTIRGVSPPYYLPASGPSLPLETKLK